MIKEAIKYGSYGWKVFPVRGKIPAIKNWQERASSDPIQLEDLFKNPHTGIGLATGEKSGITVLDIDVKNGSNGFLTLENNNINLPETVVSVTPSGGKHYFFKHTDKLKNMVSVLGEKSGLDIRNDGGYVVLPPSIVDNKKYEFLTEQEP